MKRLAIFLAVAALIGFGYWFYRNNSHSFNPVETSTSTGTATGTTTKTTATLPTKISTKGVKPALLQFLVTESGFINGTNIDSAGAEKRIETMAASMTEADMLYARDLALMEDAPADQRILAAFMLTRTPMTGFSNKLMAGVISANKDNSPRAEPHSVDEAKNMQNKAIILMELEALAARAVTDANAREELLRAEGETKDPYFKKRIHDKIQDLPPLNR